MPFIKGISGNPAGKPAGTRSIADSLRKVSQERVKVKGHYVTKADVLARMVFEALTTSATVTLSGKTIQLNAKLWVDLLRFTSVHLDGTAPTNVDITSGGQPIKAYIGYSPDDWDNIIDADIVEDEPKQLGSG